MPRIVPPPRPTPAADRGEPLAGADLSMQAWLSVVRCYHLCDAVLTQRLAALGVALPAHEVLVNLLRAPGLAQQELARRCFVAKSGISMLVSQLEAQGLLERQADLSDARVRRLVLTRRGSALARECQQVQAEVVDAMTGGQPAAMLQHILEGMQAASAVLSQMQADTAPAAPAARPAARRAAPRG